MNGIALGGSKGLFTNPGKAVGNIFSMKNVVPDLTTAAGAIVGSFIEPGVGTIIGAGLGEAAGEKIEGKSWEQSALSGVEAASIAYGGEELYAAGAGVGAGAGAGAAGAGTGTAVGNAIDAAGNYIGAGATNFIGDAVNEVGGAALSGIGSAESAFTGGVNAVGSYLGLGGASGAGAAGIGSDVLSPSLMTATQGVGSAAELPAVSAAAGGTADAAAAAPWYSAGNLLSDASKAATLGSAGMSLLRGNQPVKGENELNTAAATDTAQGQQLQNYLQTGTLPPGAQAAINQSVAAQQAAIRSQYANMGMTGSSAEAQDLANAASAGVTQATNLASSLLQTGISEYSDGTNLYGDIMNENLQKDQQLGNAIGQFATALIPGNTGSSPTAGAASPLASANAA